MKKAILPLLLIISLATIEAADNNKKVNAEPKSNTQGVRSGSYYIKSSTGINV